MRKNAYIFLLFILLLGCKNDPLNEIKLPKYSANSKSKADSLAVGEPLPLNGKRNDSLRKNEYWYLKSEFDVIPFSNQDRLPIVPFEVIKTNNKPQLSKYIPKEKIVKPFYNPVIHPKPTKAGELRSTGIANENITYLSDEQGLPSMNINHLMEDENGFFWISHTAGFSIYNGFQLYNYGKNNGIPAYPTKIIKDPTNRSVWMATSKGLINYDGKKFIIYNKDSGLPNDQIRDIVFDQKKNLWLLCSKEAILKLKDNKISVYDTSTKMPIQLALGISTGVNDEILVNTLDAGVFAIDQNNIVRYNVNNKFLSSLVTCIYLNNKKKLWVGTYGGGFGSVDDTLTVGYRPNTGFPYFIINTISEDNKNKMWFGTSDGGLICKEDGYFKLYTTKQGLTSNKINCVIHDKAGNAWVGTADAGINKITPGSFKILSNLDGFTDKTVSEIIVNKRGDVLFGTMAAGLYEFNGSYFKHYKSHGLNWKIILSMCEDAEGNLYVGTDLHGVSKLTFSKNDSIGYDSIHHISANVNFKSKFTFNIIDDKKGNIWLANYKEDPLIKLSSDHYTEFSNVGKMPLNSIGAMFCDSSGTIWIAPNSLGLSSIKNDRITHYTKKNGLIDNQVNYIYEANKNELWVGTFNGISIFNGKSFVNLTTQDGLSNNIIYSIIKDDANRIWISTNNGLNCVKKDASKPKGYSIESYFTTDGLKTNQFSKSSVAFDKRKRTLWWGTQRGAINLDLTNFDQNKFSPKVQITNVNLMDEYIDFVSLNDSINKGSKYCGADTTTSYNSVKFDSVMAYHNIPLNLSLPFDKNSISFDFFAFSGQPAGKIRYRYMLEGFDENWKNSTSSTAKFSNLKSGDYTFKVQAKLEGLDWSDAYIYQLTIRPPFWETWWFRTISFMIFVGIIGSIFRFRNRQLIIRQQQLETTVAERTEEIRKQKHLIEEKHKEITDSINYAERIQKSFLATKEHLDANLKEYFILFKPKDIVSGDFYWSSNLTNGNFILATADSTGHGVPGAIMSLLNITSLEKAIETETQPSSILNTTRNIIIERLKKDGSAEGGKDGMDCSICVYDLINKKLFIAAAHNPVWIIRGEEIIEIRSDKMPVGKHDKQTTPFTQHEIQLQEGDKVYTLTDGYADQFGGPAGKKFMSKNLRRLIAANAHLSMKEQLKVLENTFMEWAENMEQVDDVTIVGVKI